MSRARERVIGRESEAARRLPVPLPPLVKITSQYRVSTNLSSVRRSAASCYPPASCRCSPLWVKIGRCERMTNATTRTPAKSPNRPGRRSQQPSDSGRVRTTRYGHDRLVDSAMVSAHRHMIARQRDRPPYLHRPVGPRLRQPMHTISWQASFLRCTAPPRRPLAFSESPAAVHPNSRACR
jgi:hypothetical protein